METKEICRKGYMKKVAIMKVKNLVVDKCSVIFREHNFNGELKVGILLNEKGEFDLRGKKQEYRIYEL